MLGLFLLNGGLTTIYQCLGAKLCNTQAALGGIVTNEMSGGLADACCLSIAVYMLGRNPIQPAADWRAQIENSRPCIVAYSTLQTSHIV